MASAMARSSCGSWPAITSLGQFSTSTSGATPSFSTAHFPSRVKKPPRGAIIEPPSINSGVSAVWTNPPPGSFPNQQANLAALKHVGHQVATRAGHLVNDHYLWSPDSGGGDGEWITIAGDIIHVAIEIAAEYVDDIVHRGAAAIETLVNDDTFLVLL